MKIFKRRDEEFNEREYEPRIKDVISGDSTQSKVRHKGIWLRFFHMCKLAHIPYIMIVAFIILTVIQGMIIVKIPQINGNFFAGDVSVKSVAMFIGFEVISTLLGQLILFMNHILRYKMNYNMRNALWGKILKLKPSYYDKVSSSTLISRITVDSDALNGFVMDIVIEGGNSIYMLVLTIAEMSAISMKAGFTLLAFAPLTVILSFVIGRINLRFENSKAHKFSDFTNYLSELISCLPLLKSVNMQRYEARRGRKVIDDYYKKERNLVGLSVGSSFAGSLVGIGPELFIIMAGIKLLNAHDVDAAGWYTFYLYAGTFLTFFNTLGSYWQNTKTIQGKMNKIADVLDEEEEGIETYVSEIVESGDIIFDNVSFGYGDETLLKKVNFHIPKNQSTAIVGFSGSGKSTIIKLLDRLYEPKEGSILTSGTKISDFELKKWREKVAFVPQNAPLMSGSIRENATYGIKRAVSDEEIMEAARLAHVDRFISENLSGLDFEVGQFGSNLSGGQRQKIAIARAILSGSEILIMDEPTASLDIISAKEIQKTIEHLKGMRTLVTVTHDTRISEGADHIVVVASDHSVMEGNKAEMYKMNEFFREFMGQKEGKEKNNG